jgi:hypothetical protein
LSADIILEFTAASHWSLYGGGNVSLTAQASVDPIANTMTIFSMTSSDPTSVPILSSPLVMNFYLASNDTSGLFTVADVPDAATFYDINNLVMFGNYGFKASQDNSLISFNGLGFGYAGNITWGFSSFVTPENDVIYSATASNTFGDWTDFHKTIYWDLVQEYSPPTAVPEPSAGLLVALAAACMLFYRRRRPSVK